MRNLLLIIVLVLPVLATAQQNIDVDQLTIERKNILEKIDSLEKRLVEIDTQLSFVSPEDKLEAMISKYGKNKGKLIASGRVWTSISPEMALDSWGEPEKIQKSELSSGATEKWSYPNGNYLFFKNGRLESWKE